MKKINFILEGNSEEPVPAARIPAYIQLIFLFSEIHAFPKKIQTLDIAITKALQKGKNKNKDKEQNIAFMVKNLMDIITQSKNILNKMVALAGRIEEIEKEKKEEYQNPFNFFSTLLLQFQIKLQGYINNINVEFKNSLTGDLEEINSEFQQFLNSLKENKAILDAVSTDEFEKSTHFFEGKGVEAKLDTPNLKLIETIDAYFNLLNTTGNNEEKEKIAIAIREYIGTAIIENQALTISLIDEDFSKSVSFFILNLHFVIVCSKFSYFIGGVPAVTKDFSSTFQSMVSNYIFFSRLIKEKIKNSKKSSDFFIDMEEELLRIEKSLSEYCKAIQKESEALGAMQGASIDCSEIFKVLSQYRIQFELKQLTAKKGKESQNQKFLLSNETETTVLNSEISQQEIRTYMQVLAFPERIKSFYNFTNDLTVTINYACQALEAVGVKLEIIQSSKGSKKLADHIVKLDSGLSLLKKSIKEILIAYDSLLQRAVKISALIENNQTYKALYFSSLTVFYKIHCKLIDFLGKLKASYDSFIRKEGILQQNKEALTSLLDINLIENFLQQAATQTIFASLNNNDIDKLTGCAISQTKTIRILQEQLALGSQLTTETLEDIHCILMMVSETAAFEFFQLKLNSKDFSRLLPQIKSYLDTLILKIDQIVLYEPSLINRYIKNTLDKAETLSKLIYRSITSGCEDGNLKKCEEAFAVFNKALLDRAEKHKVNLYYKLEFAFQEEKKNNVIRFKVAIRQSSQEIQTLYAEFDSALVNYGELYLYNDNNFSYDEIVKFHRTLQVTHDELLLKASNNQYIVAEVSEKMMSATFLLNQHSMRQNQVKKTELNEKFEAICQKNQKIFIHMEANDLPELEANYKAMRGIHDELIALVNSAVSIQTDSLYIKAQVALESCEAKIKELKTRQADLIQQYKTDQNILCENFFEIHEKFEKLSVYENVKNLSRLNQHLEAMRAIYDKCLRNFNDTLLMTSDQALEKIKHMFGEAEGKVNRLKNKKLDLERQHESRKLELSARFEIVYEDFKKISANNNIQTLPRLEIDYQEMTNIYNQSLASFKSLSMPTTNVILQNMEAHLETTKKQITILQKSKDSLEKKYKADKEKLSGEFDALFKEFHRLSSTDDAIYLPELKVCYHKMQVICNQLLQSFQAFSSSSENFLEEMNEKLENSKKQIEFTQKMKEDHDRHEHTKKTLTAEFKKVSDVLNEELKNTKHLPNIKTYIEELKNIDRQLCASFASVSLPNYPSIDMNREIEKFEKQSQQIDEIKQLQTTYTKHYSELSRMWKNNKPATDLLPGWRLMRNDYQKILEQFKNLSLPLNHVVLDTMLFDLHMYQQNIENRDYIESLVDVRQRSSKVI